MSSAAQEMLVTLHRHRLRKQLVSHCVSTLRSQSERVFYQTCFQN